MMILTNAIILLLLLTYNFIINIKCNVSISKTSELLVDDDVKWKNITIGKLNERINIDEYLKLRQHLYDKNLVYDFQNDMILNEREKIVNEIVMKLKLKEINEGFQNPYNFTPSRHFFKVIEKIKKSKLFQIIKLMPKGGILHAHDTALCSPDYVLALTYREHLWQCFDNDSYSTDAGGNHSLHPNMINKIDFRFSRTKPTLNGNGKNCEWQKVCDLRLQMGNSTYDNKIKSLFTLFTKHPLKKYTDINAVWSTFAKLFQILRSIVTYAPVWKDYYKNALKEMYADGVQYLEFRGVIPTLYDLDGNIYAASDVVQLYKDGLDEFMTENSNFIGSKFIYAPNRNVNDTKFNDYLVIVKELHRQFPTFMAGFDLVGQEDLGRPLIDFVPKLLELSNDIKFFFHAGETNWFGTSSDENLIDAILLGSQRIGHGYALIKHPALIELIKEKDIAIEINPISNQVLKLVDDLRNHPASYFFANNIPIIISSDDPSFWNATPLSHDFYETFLGITSKHSDLRTLKKLAMNSIKYSSLNESEKLIAFNKWQLKWNEFIDKMIMFNK